MNKVEKRSIKIGILKKIFNAIIVIGMFTAGILLIDTWTLRIIAGVVLICWSYNISKTSMDKHVLQKLSKSHFTKQQISKIEQMNKLNNIVQKVANYGELNETPVDSSYKH